MITFWVPGKIAILQFFHVWRYSKLLDPSSTREVQAEAILKVVKQLELGLTVVAFIFYSTGINSVVDKGVWGLSSEKDG